MKLRKGLVGGGCAGGEDEVQEGGVGGGCAGGEDCNFLMFHVTIFLLEFML